jgi:hypothetical protein
LCFCGKLFSVVWISHLRSTIIETNFALAGLFLEEEAKRQDGHAGDDGSLQENRNSGCNPQGEEEVGLLLNKEKQEDFE